VFNKIQYWLAENEVFIIRYFLSALLHMFKVVILSWTDLIRIYVVYCDVFVSKANGYKAVHMFLILNHNS